MDQEYQLTYVSGGYEYDPETYDAETGKRLTGCLPEGSSRKVVIYDDSDCAYDDTPPLYLELVADTVRAAEAARTAEENAREMREAFYRLRAQWGKP